MARFDRLEEKLETIIGKLLNEVDGNKPKDLLSDEFFKFLRNHPKVEESRIQCKSKPYHVNLQI